MTEKKTSVLFKIIKWLVKVFYPKTQVEGIENLPDEPVIIVGNHTQLHGPIVSELYLPFPRKIWCAGQMMSLSEVPGYAFSDFWSQKPRYLHPFFRLLSYIIAPLSVLIFNNAHTIAVHRDARILSTFKETVSCLKNGESIVIFPEHDVKYNNIVYEFQDKFVDLARMYFKKTGRALSFVPMYLAPKLKKMYIGKPIAFDPEANIKAERGRICQGLMEAITELAAALPRHRVVPYPNMLKREYPYSLPIEEKDNEKTCG